jgi:hypothetical protein
MSEHLPPDASRPEHDIPTGLSRWDRAFLQIENGVSRAEQEQVEIDEATASSIAEFLAEAAGPGSALELFQPGRSNQYEPMRDEYLQIYNDPETPPEVKRWIDWFGTYLVRSELGDRRDEAIHSLKRFPRLDRLLVPMEFPLTHHPPIHLRVPGDLDGAALQRLNEHFDTLDLVAWPAFRAFLRLPHIHGALLSLEQVFYSRFVGAYDNRQDMVVNVSDYRHWRRELREWTEARHLPPEAVRLDHHALEQWIRHEYAVIEYEGRLYVFR